jgi:hypothetical protein
VFAQYHTWTGTLLVYPVQVIDGSSSYESIGYVFELKQSTIKRVFLLDR